MVPMSLPITRREIAVALSSSVALLAQTPTTPPQPQSPDEELKAAREQLHQNQVQLAQFPLPMPTEPACHFKP